MWFAFSGEVYDCSHMKQPNIIKDKSFLFAIEIIDLSKLLMANKEYVLSKQVLRSGTAIGALVREAEHAESKRDFIHKLSISLKESNETDYWLTLLKRTGYIQSDRFLLLEEKNIELRKLLIRIIKTSKERLYQSK